MKNRVTVEHGMLDDLRQFLSTSGWKLHTPVGKYEVLRATKPGYPRPLLVYNRESGGCGYSIHERDIRVYKGWKRNRIKRGLPAESTIEERQRYWKGEGE